MDFTREPIIETVITPKEGCKLVVRSSKSSGQEEYFVDALEVVAFGHSIFYRSLERPKAFIVPASDYEVLEVREARMVLKNVGLDRSIKIGGGRESAPKPPKEPVQEKSYAEEEVSTNEESTSTSAEKPEGRKRDKRRQYRRRRGRDDATAKEGGDESLEERDSADVEPIAVGEPGDVSPEPSPISTTGASLASILPPPPMLISETIGRYKENVLFKGAFYNKDEDKEEPVGVEEEPVAEAEEGEGQEAPAIPQPEYGSFEMSEDEEEEIYRQRSQQRDFLSPADDLPATAHQGAEEFPETAFESTSVEQENSESASQDAVPPEASSEERT